MQEFKAPVIPITTNISTILITITTITTNSTIMIAIITITTNGNIIITITKRAGSGRQFNIGIFRNWR